MRIQTLYRLQNVSTILAGVEGPVKDAAARLLS